MHIYIDESGSFVIPRIDNGPSIACCGALAVPSDCRDKIFSEFLNLSRNWPKINGELKGRLLQESHFNEAINFFSDRGLLLNAIVIDMNQQKESDVMKHRDKTIHNLSTKLPPNYRQKNAAVDPLVRGMNNVSPQLYTQMMLMTEVVWNAFVTNFRWLSLADPLGFVGYLLDD